MDAPYMINFRCRSQVIFVVTFLLLMTVAGYSHAGNFLLNAQIGSGKVRLNSSVSDSIRTTEFDTVGGSIYGGYIFDNKLFTKVGFGRQTSEDLFGISDTAVLKTYEALVGYSIDFNRFYVRPQIGAGHWRLNFDEGFFLNPGDEESIKKSGDDLLLLMDVGYDFTDRIGMRLSYKTIKSDIGRYSSSTVGLNIRF
jgi:hypothetical protein